MQWNDFNTLMRMKGWVLFDCLVPPDLLERLPRDLDRAYERCRRVQVQNGLAQDTSGTAHHILGGGDSLDEFIQKCPLLDLIQGYLGGKCILNSFGGVLNFPGESSYVGKVHRDVRSYFAGQPLMVNMLVMLDDFTEQNGATYILTGTHHIAERPPDEFFFQYADRLLGKRGSIVLWDSYLWHAAGHNQSSTPRRALTLSFTRPFFKQQMDYTRMVGPAYVAHLDDETKQLLGLNARMPSSLEEWYQPIDKRFYKADQG